MLNSDSFKTLLHQDPILYVDAGARGDLEGDWRNFPDGCLSVLAFEPDVNAPIDWQDGEKLRHLERSALWSSQTDVDIHIGKIGSTSSVWPPNMDYLKRFASRHVDPRATQSIASVRARPLDAILADRGLCADFLKIDTQGAELQILQGASDALDRSVIGVVAETWTIPVHKGQGLTHDIMALMSAKGFIVCQVETAAAWDRKIVETENISHRRQIVGLDILFMRDPTDIKDRFSSANYAAKFAVIAQMYGHYDLALEALNLGIRQSGENPLLLSAQQDIRAAHAALTAPPPSPSLSLLGKIRNRLRPPAIVRRNAETKLHY